MTRNGLGNNITWRNYSSITIDENVTQTSIMHQILRALYIFITSEIMQISTESVSSNHLLKHTISASLAFSQCGYRIRYIREDLENKYSLLVVTPFGLGASISYVSYLEQTPKFSRVVSTTYYFNHVYYIEYYSPDQSITMLKNSVSSNYEACAQI